MRVVQSTNCLGYARHVKRGQGALDNQGQLRSESLVFGLLPFDGWKEFFVELGNSVGQSVITADKRHAISAGHREDIDMSEGASDRITPRMLASEQDCRRIFDDGNTMLSVVSDSQGQLLRQLPAARA